MIAEWTNNNRQQSENNNYCEQNQNINMDIKVVSKLRNFR